MLSEHNIDDALVKASQQGDKGAFARLLSIIYDLIYCFSLKWSGSRADAEDITQQVCIKLARIIRQFRFESAFTTWLYRVVVNSAQDWSRSQARHHQGRNDDALCDYEQRDSGDAIEAQSEIDRVLKLIDGLGKGFKETALLVYAEGFSHKEAADILGIKESTVSWRVHKIRKRLSSEQQSQPQPQEQHQNQAPQHSRNALSKGGNQHE